MKFLNMMWGLHQEIKIFLTPFRGFISRFDTRNHGWKIEEGWRGPNGVQWEIRTRRFGPGIPHGHDLVCVDTDTEMGLFCVSSDGNEQLLYSHFTTVPAMSMDRSFRVMRETANRQIEAPALVCRPRVGTRVSVPLAGDGIVFSHCIHINEWDGDTGECQSRGDFSAVSIRLDDGTMIARFPEEVNIIGEHSDVE